MQQAASSAMSVASAQKAGFWIRFLAILIDSIILGIVTNIIASIFGLNPTGRGGLQTLFGIIYYVYFWSNSSLWPGQTIGNKLLNIRVIKTDGSDLDLGVALIRYVGLIISCLVIFIGVIWAAFDANKQGWHDKIAGTYVVKATS
jgi:uncharacterized RDD family membrane protein YckC